MLEYYVVKRNGSQEKISIDKIKSRLLNLCDSYEKEVIDIGMVCNKVLKGICPNVTTAELDKLMAEICVSLVFKHFLYENLAAKIEISKLHKETPSRFSDAISYLYNQTSHYTSGIKSSYIADDVFDIIMKYSIVLDGAINYDRDYNFNYFGFKTLEYSYLLKINGKIIERPQHMFMRVAVGIHKDDLDSVLETYNLLSEKWFIHASPTLFHAGTAYPQLASCYVFTIKEDSLDGVFKTLSDCAQALKYSGGIGLNVHNIRSAGSPIHGNAGISNGLVPMLQMFNSTVRFINQSNKRPGSFAIYVEPWHADIFDFLRLRKHNGNESRKTLDLFTGLWIPNLFMKRILKNSTWTLMDPKKCPGLSDCWGKEFETLYESYENQGLGEKTVKAKDLWKEILDSQIETGTPYMLYKDSCNEKSNHQHLGTIKGSNLCAEIIEFNSPKEIAVCNIASISLPKFVNQTTKKFDFDELIRVVGVVTKNLNKIIDINYYPIFNAELSNKRYRAIGIGVQGLADVFAVLRYPFESEKASMLNKKIFETIYYGALKLSCELAQKFGTYETYEGSPISKGILQPDMWGVECSENLDWKQLRENITKYGVRNSLLIAPMPTVATSQIMGNTECFEPFSSNMYLRRVHGGEFVVVNRYLMKDLIELNLWSENMKNIIISNRGSIQNINVIPLEVKELYKTVWEINQSTIIQMAVDRAPFIDQSQSLNLHLSDPDYQTLTTLHFMGWKKGLKTGMYYLRTKPAANPIQFTINLVNEKNSAPDKLSNMEVDCDPCHG